MIRRLVRDLRAQKLWVISLVVLVALSSGIYSSFRSTYDSGIRSLDNAGAELRSADIVVSTRPMNDISGDIGNVSGVGMVSSALLMDCYTYANGVRVRGELNAVELGPRVNDYSLLAGRDAGTGTEVVVEHHYADNHALAPGDDLTIYVNGAPMNFTVSGICFSPEYIYLISPEGWLERDFGVFFVLRDALDSPVNASANTFYVRTSDNGQSARDISSAIQESLTGLGVNAVVKCTDDTFAYTAFREDLGAMKSLANIFSVLLLVVSAIVLFTVLSRLVDRKRREIGVLRAMGFRKHTIFFYYMSISLIGVSLGVLLSLPVGLGILAYMMDVFAVNALGIPGRFLAYDLDMTYVGYAALFSLLIGVMGAIAPAYRAASLTPVEAMRSYSASRGGARVMTGSSVSPMKKLAIREMVGHPVRTFSTVVVIALVLSLGLSFALSIGSFQRSIDRRFNINERWDLMIRFDGSPGASALAALHNAQWADRVEPYTGSDVTMVRGSSSVVVQMHRMAEGTEMHVFSLAEGSLDPGGILISRDVAHRLDVGVGDTVTVYSTFGSEEAGVAGILAEFGSSEAYMLGNVTEPTGALVTVHSGMSGQANDYLWNMSSVSSWAGRTELRDGWVDLMNEYYGMVYAMDMVTVILVCTTVGLFAFISAMERRWESVVLRTMGFSGPVLVRSVLPGSVIPAAIGVLLSIPLSMHLATLFNATFESLMAPPPTVLLPGLVLARCLLVIFISAVSTAAVTALSLRQGIAGSLRHVFNIM